MGFTGTFAVDTDEISTQKTMKISTVRGAAKLDEVRAEIGQAVKRVDQKVEV